MKSIASNLPRLCSLLVCFLPFHLASANLKLLPQDEQFFFAATESTLSIAIENSSDAPLTGFQYQLFQASSATLAPVTEIRSLEAAAFPPAQVTLARIPISSPPVRAITPFVLKLFFRDTELGSVPLRVCPTNLLAGLNSLAPRLALHEPDDLLASLLHKNAISFTPASVEAFREFSDGLLLVRLTDKQQLPALLDITSALPLRSSVLYIVSPGVPSAEKLLPLKITKGTAHPSAILQDWFVPDLNSSPLSQLRFLRSLELLLKPELVKTPQPVK